MSITSGLLHRRWLVAIVIAVLVFLQAFGPLLHQTLAENSQYWSLSSAQNISALQGNDAAASLFHRLQAQILPQGTRRNPSVTPLNWKEAAKLDAVALAEVIWMEYSQRLREQQRRNGGKRPRVIIYQCAVSNLCAGFGDRVRGMAFAFVAALLSDSAFAIEHLVPVDLVDIYTDLTYRHEALFLDPTQLKQYGTNHTLRLFSPYNITRTRSLDFNSLLDQYSTLIINSNELTWIDLIDNPQLVDRAKQYGLDRLASLDIFRIFSYLYLTHPAPSIASAVQGYIREISPDGNHTKVGVQIRTGSGERERAPIQSVGLFAQEVAQYCLELKCSVFLTSDLPTAATMFMDKLKELAPSILIVQSSGQPVHIHNGAIAEAHMKTFIDWTILCKMDFLVISRSGFGEIPSWISQVPTRQVLGIDHVIDFDNILDHGLRHAYMKE